jgi:hypothetical protein
VTAVALGAAIVSGIDAQSFRASYDGESRAQQVNDYSTGVAKMDLTNALFGVAGLGAAFTAAAALWLVDWKGAGASVHVGLGPGTLQLSGGFR